MDLQSLETIAALSAENESMETNEEGDAETQGPARNETQSTLTVFDSNPGKRADVWKQFVWVGIGEDGKERVRCIHCSKKFVIGKNLGTSTLRRHSLSCLMKPKNESVGGNDGQDRPIYDHKHKSLVVVGASVSKSSCDREGVSNILSKKRQRSSLTEGKTQTRSATLLGLDILDCPVCFKPLTIPIFQCDNGHLVCSSCCPKLSDKCYACAFPIGHNRCRAMECVLESVFVPCQNADFGCTQNVSYGKESSTHEKECIFSQCACPALDCSYTGSYKDVYSHFVDDDAHHQNYKPNSISFVCGGSVDVQINVARDKILVLWEFKKSLLFALQCFRDMHGVFVTVTCIAPSAPEVEKFDCRYDYSMDGHELTYKSAEVKRVLEVSSRTPQDNFMFVPHCLLHGELLEIKLCIGLKVRVDS